MSVYVYLHGAAKLVICDWICENRGGDSNEKVGGAHTY